MVLVRPGSAYAPRHPLAGRRFPIQIVVAVPIMTCAARGWLDQFDAALET